MRNVLLVVVVVVLGFGSAACVVDLGQFGGKQDCTVDAVVNGAMHIACVPVR